MSYEEHAKREFKAAGWTDADGKFKDQIQEMVCKQVLELLNMFSEHGHSGSSAPYAIQLFKTLASFEPVVPITGEGSEWNEVGEGHFQNSRCSHVFKDTNRFGGQAYDSEAIIFYDWYVDSEGVRYKSHYTCKESSQPITFPYTPKREYKERP